MVIGVLLFDVRIIRACAFTLLAIVVMATVAEQLGVVPYAPFYAESAVEASHLATFRLLVLALAFVILVGSAIFLIESTDLLRDRERKLRRANDLIRRYVPTQLAERILAG